MKHAFTLTGLLALGSLLPGFAQTKSPCFKASGYKVGSLPSSVAVGDINGDGRLDFATAPSIAKAPNTYTISILLAQQGGGYQLSEYSIDSYSQSIAVADLDGNGRADILMTNTLGGAVTVLRSQSDGSFVRSDYQTPTTPFMVTTQDVNGDNKPDIITANPSAGGSSVSVFLSQANGEYVRDDYSTGAGRSSRWVAVGDVNGDNRPDLVTANPNNSSISILLGQLGGKFGASTDYSIGGSVFGVAVGDLDKDGRADIVVDLVNDNAVAVLLTKADGTFARSDYPTGSAPWEVRLGDVNGDGQLDIVTANHNELNVSVLLGLPSGQFIPRIDQRVTGNGAPYSVAISDVNDDKITDLVTANFGTSSVSVLLGQPVPDITLTVDGTLSCYTPGVTLVAVGAPAGASYDFKGPAVSNVNSNSATAGQLGTYMVTVNSGGCPVIATADVTGNLTLPQNVTLDKSGALTCLNTSVKLTAGSSTDGVRYAFSGPVVSGVDNATASAGKGGQYTVTVTRSDNGCSAQLSTTVEENTSPPQAVQLINGGALTCLKTSTSLTPSSDTPDVTFALSGPSLTGTNATGPGQYTVTATNPANGCTATTTTDVSQNIAPPVGVNLSSNGSLSANNPAITLTASSNTTANVGISYGFSQPAQKINETQATVTTSGPYSVTATRSDNGCSATATTTVLGATSITACRGASATLNLTAAGSPARYEWYVGVATGSPLRDGAYYQSAATANLTVVRVTQSQVYYARVFYVDGSSVVYGPYRVTMNPNCGAREAAIVKPGESTAPADRPGNELRITLLGNPLQGEALKALVEGGAGQRLHVELLDLSGKPVKTQVFESADARQFLDWNLSGSVSGLYLLQAVSGQQRHTAKVLKP